MDKISAKGKPNKEENRVKTTYGDIEYAEIGPRDGAVVLFVTGGGASYRSAHAFAWLSQAGFRIISINRPGYLGLPLRVVDDIEGHADIYHEVLVCLGIRGKVNVFGVSMGGLSALYYAKKYPVKALVLWSAVTGKYTVNKESVNSTLGKLVLTKNGKKIISALLLISAKWFPKKTICTFLETEADLNRNQRMEIARQIINDSESKEEFMLFIRSMAPMDQLYEGMMDEVEKASQLSSVDWSGIPCPTLAIHSILDIDVSMEHAQRIEEMVPNSRLKYVKAGGHFVWWGNEGKEVKEETIRFFRQWNPKIKDNRI